MSGIEKLLKIISVFCLKTGLSSARVSTLVFNDGKRIRRLGEGSDIGTRTLERAMKWFSTNWPEGTEWPDNIERPLVGGLPHKGADSIPQSSGVPK